MIPSVILALALVTSGLALPFTTQDTTITGTPTGIHTEGGTPISQTFTHGEKTGTVQTPEGQTYGTVTGSEITNPITQTVEKTGITGTLEGITQTQTGGKTLGTGVTTGEKTGVYTGTHEKQTGYETVQPVVSPVGQSGVQSETYVQQKYPEAQSVNTAVSKSQGEHVNYEQPQTPFTERPVLLPVQPLSVVPVGQGLTPVVVPTEAIAAGRIIIMTVEPIRQQLYPQDLLSTAEKQVPYPQGVQTAVNEYVPVQNPVQVPEVNQQVYSSQPAQPCPPCSEQNFPCPPCPQPVQKQQVPYQQQQTQSGVTQTTQVGESYQQPITRSEIIGSTFEKQTVGEYTPVQTQTSGVNTQYQTGQQVVPSGVEKQGTGYTGETTQQGLTTGTVEKQGYQPVGENTQVQNSQVQPYTPQQQQVYNVQPQVTGQNVVEQQVPHGRTTQGTEEQGYKTGAVEHPQQQQYNPQSQEVNPQQSNVQQVTNYVAEHSAERVPVFGEKLQQQQQHQQQQQYVDPSKVETQNPVQTFSVLPSTQQESVVPESSVVVSQ